MYIAQKYIGNDYTPGETLPDDLPQEFIERLLKTGAIRKAAPLGQPLAPEPQIIELRRRQPDAGEARTPETRPDETEAEPEGEADEDEIDEDEDAPEIDAMDGIVQGDAEPKDAPGKKTAAKKPAAKKTTGGRKAK
ncbi:MAG: hypothetical protein IKN04_11900 [Clostridia bacterium]|nr:hypothetical protein [Clostridia bacterium]